MLDVLKTRAHRFLRWTERYTKTDMVYAARGGIWLVIGRVIVILSGLIVSVVFANLVPKEVYGTYQFIMSMAVVVGAFTLSGMSVAITRAVARGSDGALRAGVRIQLMWSMGMVIAGGAFALYYFLNGNRALGESFLIVGAFSPFLTAFGLTQSFFIGRHLFRESAVFGLWRRLLPAVAVVVTIFLTHDLVTLVLVYFASNTLSAALLYRMTVERFRLPNTPDKELTSYGMNQSIMGTFGEVFAQVDRVLVFHFLGAAPLAAYSLSLLPVKQIEGIFKLLESLTFPKLSITDFSVIKSNLPHKVRILLLIAAVVVIVYILICPFFFGLFFPAYPESILVSQVLILIMLSKPRTLYMQALVAHDRRREQYQINITAAILRIVLLWFLLPVWHLWGAVAALLLTHLYANVTTRYVFWRAKA